ncbi:MAG: alpha-L-fucosidase [Lentisphaeria bacterium]|nr:alpha-L-fucosidase [Lentisphaeria bacterium]
MNSWIEKAYSRLLIDNHITEDDPSFMTRFDPEQYVAMVRTAGVEAAMVYATCHNGNCYYPTKVGHMHANLRGRDIFGEVISGLRREGIVPVAYYTTVYHNQSAKDHPEWRVTGAQGQQHGGRYWWSCPNSDAYTAFTLAQIAEIVAYDIEGIFVDMTFWPLVCVCPNCRAKYLAETGRAIPTKIRWDDPEWVAFQRFRERSMGRFTQTITDSIRAIRDVTVTHQTSTIMHGWRPGYTLAIADACDYTSGDFYGGKVQHILGTKVLAGASKRLPFEFMTSRCVNLRDHTSMKAEAELECEAACTLASGGAFFFIDAINPDGTLEPAVYQRLGAVSNRLAPFTRAVKRHRPVLHADTALYFSPESFVDSRQDAEIMTPSGNIPAVEELTGLSMALTRAHRPFRVVTPRTADFGGLRTLFLGNVRYLSDAEIERLRGFVASGGVLIATGLASLQDMDGVRRPDFGLADVFGVSYTGRQAGRFHYLSACGRREYVASHASGPLVEATTARVLAYINEPLFDPDAERYASIHSNPPGVDTPFAGLTRNRFGKGSCVYLAPPLLSLQQDAQQSFAARLFAEFAPGTVVLGTNAPPAVEVTVLRSTTARSWFLGLMNYQRDLPNVPVHGLRVTVSLPEEGLPVAVRRISDGAPAEWHAEGTGLSVDLPVLRTLEMIEFLFG